MLVNHGPSQQSSKEEYKHLIRRSCHQRRSPCQDPAGNRTKRRPPDHRKEIQTARHSESGKKTRQTKEEVGRHHQGMDRPGVRQVPEGSGEQGKLEKTGCKIISGAPTTFADKGLIIMMMMMMTSTLPFLWPELSSGYNKQQCAYSGCSNDT